MYLAPTYIQLYQSMLIIGMVKSQNAHKIQSQSTNLGMPLDPLALAC